jgi:hypothetical protein
MSAIHTHQCIIKWVGNQVEVIEVDDIVCVAVAESQADVQGGRMSYLIGRDLT